MVTWQQINLLRLEQCWAMWYHLLSVVWQLRQWQEPWVVKVLAVVLSEDYSDWELMGLLPAWGFCIEDLGTSWIFVLGTLYTVNGIGVSFAVGHFVDVVVDFVIEVEWQLQ